MRRRTARKIYFLLFGVFILEVMDTENYRIDPRKQFSKRLARWTSVFWFFYMTWRSVILIIQPAAAVYSVYMGVIATAVMVLNVWAYTRNSIYEKGVFAMLDKTKLELTMRGGQNPKAGKAQDEAAESENDEEGSEADG